MTPPTAVVPPNQELERLSSTDPLSAKSAATSALDAAPRTKRGRPTSTQIQSGQAAPGGSTWSTRSAYAQPADSRRVTGLDKWEGKILEIEDDAFTAELHPIEDEGIPITADFNLDLLGSDAATVVPGDVFYLVVRTVKGPGMRPSRTESLRLRRLGRITPEEVDEVYARADTLMERLEQLSD